jgi:hypothetical protein
MTVRPPTWVLMRCSRSTEGTRVASALVSSKKTSSIRLTNPRPGCRHGGAATQVGAHALDGRHPRCERARLREEDELDPCDQATRMTRDRSADRRRRLWTCGRPTVLLPTTSRSALFGRPQGPQAPDVVARSPTERIFISGFGEASTHVGDACSVLTDTRRTALSRRIRTPVAS